ncbi:receptor-like protein 6 [Ziziphus jujuba]|uniref:Receptor-like protein 6 n=1 Tax=Ziziphus jujuba TaxID=326968 RepID=A0ABM3IWU4_ZIZJJ|nr:receptor-like protein 6 [Ziziphus jujuba]
MSIFDGIFRGYAVLIAAFVVLAETEWEFIIKFWRPLCHKDEHTALLQFKQSFIVDKSTCFEPSDLPKTTSWKEEGAEDCCSWDGVECDEKSGHVIGVDLSSSCLYGSINSTSTLFHLSQLQMLNLAFNDFNYSRIPSALGHLSRLTHLNLSYSFLYGQVPSEILQLSNLVLLDLSRNADFSAEIELLKLDKPDVSSLVHNLTKLEHLRLSYVDINSEVPAFLGNLSSLTSLTLKYCGLYGKFPKAVFSLPNLQILKFDGNQRLSGFLHEFHSGCPLKVFSLSQMEFRGQIPPSLQNMTQLNRLDLGDNRLTGQLPSWFANFTQLAMLDISSNFLTGAVPPSFSRLRNLEFFSLAINELSGTVDIDMFLGMKYLASLQLQYNKLTVLTRSAHNASIPKLEILGLDFCYVFIFPDFLRYQHSLINLGLRGNHLSGQVPSWLWNTSMATVESIDISHNNLIGFDQSQLVIPGVSLRFLDLSFNMLKGTLPIPPPSIIMYDIPNNELSGQVSPSFCNLPSLQLACFHNV